MCALLAHFLELTSLQHICPAPAVTTAALQCLREYAWPGNVRELKNVAERLVVRDFGRPVQVDDLPEEVRSAFVSARLPAMPPPMGDALRPDGIEPAAPEAVLESAVAAASRGGHVLDVRRRAVARNHDLTRQDVHALVQRGLNETQGQLPCAARHLQPARERLQARALVSAAAATVTCRSSGSAASGRAARTPRRTRTPRAARRVSGVRCRAKACPLV